MRVYLTNVEGICRRFVEEKRELENELEEVYLGKARAEAEREEAMAALRQHREKEEMDMNRLLEEVGYLKSEVYAS